LGVSSELAFTTSNPEEPDFLADNWVRIINIIPAGEVKRVFARYWTNSCFPSKMGNWIWIKHLEDYLGQY
jgi:hypothetical protein